MWRNARARQYQRVLLGWHKSGTNFAPLRYSETLMPTPADPPKWLTRRLDQLTRDQRRIQEVASSSGDIVDALEAELKRCATAYQAHRGTGIKTCEVSKTLESDVWTIRCSKLDEPRHELTIIFPINSGQLTARGAGTHRV